MKTKFINSVLKISILLIFNLIIFNLQSANSQMYWNQAASFSGTVGSHVAVPNSASLNITGSFTLEAWINPSSVPFLGKGIISKSTGLNIKYAMRYSSGRISLLTSSATRLVSRVSNPIPANVWTHVAATFDNSSGIFRIYINGLVDTSVTIAGAAPLSSNDSLYIGTSGLSTDFSGFIDEVRIWKKSLSGIQITTFMKSSLGTSGELDFGSLILSITFQNNLGSSPIFSAMDHSDNSNNGFIRNVSALDLKDRPSGIHFANDCVNFRSSGILTALDNSSISPTNKVTIECWVYPEVDNFILLSKGSYIPFIPDYSLGATSGKLYAYINNILISSTDSIKKNRWSHLAFTYFGTTGRYEFFVNGKKGTTGNIAPQNIIDGSDSLLVGNFALVGFRGFLDELRITHDIKSASEINSQMFTSINESNDNDATTNAIYNFDGSTLPSTFSGPRFNVRAFANFNFNYSQFKEVVQSPVNNFSSGQFQNGYYLSMPNKRIPLSGTSGTIRDTIEILTQEIISDLNIYIALNHKKNANLRLSLTSPLGASTEFFANTTLLDSNNGIVTMFDSDADSSLISNRYVSFGPRIKSQFDVDAIFGGSNSKGKWILSITDDGGIDTGFITSWGLQINNNNSLPFNLECTSLTEGFYNSATNTIIADTMRYYLRSSVFPYSIIDSSKAKFNSSGTAIASFTKAQQLTDYFLVLRHRNSIETWSSSVVQFTQFTKQAKYNFSDLQTKAFGNNMKQIDTSPVSFGLYSGDQNQDGLVDLNDVVNVFNDANNFINGYVASDMNGDNTTDLSDIVMTFNNSGLFVSAITP